MVESSGDPFEIHSLPCAANRCRDVCFLELIFPARALSFTEKNVGAKE